MTEKQLYEVEKKFKAMDDEVGGVSRLCVGICLHTRVVARTSNTTSDCCARGHGRRGEVTRGGEGWEWGSRPRGGGGVLSARHQLKANIMCARQRHRLSPDPFVGAMEPPIPLFPTPQERAEPDLRAKSPSAPAAANTYTSTHTRAYRTSHKRTPH